MKSSKATKFDDADWHSGDAANDVQAGIHIAMVFHWLRMRGLLLDKFIPEDKALETRTILPGAFFLEREDGKLMSATMVPEAAAFLSYFYEKGYLPFIDRRKWWLQYDKRYEPPYDLKDSWRNVDRVGRVLDRTYRHWKKKQTKS